MNRVKAGRHHFYKNVEFWAEDGMITIVDTEKAGNSETDVDECIKRVRPVEFLQRAAAELAYYKNAPYNLYIDAVRMLEAAQAAVKLALFHGDPCDVHVQRYHAKHNRRNSIVVPQSASPVNYKIKYPDDPKRILLDGVSIVPDFTTAPNKAITARDRAILRDLKQGKGRIKL